MFQVGCGATEIFKPEKALVFITNKRELLLGAALVTDTYAITLSFPVYDIFHSRESSQALFVGIGIKPSNKNSNNFLYPVTSVIDNRLDRNSRYYRSTFVAVSSPQKTSIF